MAGTLTEASLLSGTPAKDRSKQSRGGLLREIGSFGYLVVKDFTSVLSMNREVRSSVLAALREIYDGNWTRNVGTDGGRTLNWRGKLALLCGCTPTIDSHHGVMATMGERFLFYRIGRPDEQKQATSALKHVGQETAMRQELASAVNEFFSTPPAVPDIGDVLTDKSRASLVSLATLIARGRSAVERDGYSREVTLIPDSEAPTRLVVSLARLLAGMVAIGVTLDEAWRVIRKVAIDCLPAIRKSAFESLLPDGVADTTAIANALDYPTGTTRRALEDLTAHGLVQRTSMGKGKADLWSLTKWARDEYARAGFPEKSGDAK